MFSYYKFTNKQIKMLQTLPEEVFVYLSDFLTVTDTVYVCLVIIGFFDC